MKVKNDTKTIEKPIDDGEVKYVQTPLEKLADECLTIAIKQYDTAELFQKNKFDNILKNEEMLAGKTQPALKGRNNVNLDSVIMSGFLDTLLANQDEPVNIKFKQTREQDLKASKKITAVWDREKSPVRGNYDAYILDSKYFAAISGRGFLKMWVESLPVFAANMDCVDHFDMLTEPMGGPYLDKHLYKGQRNIFREQSYLESMASSGVYNARQVTKLKTVYSSEDFKKNQENFKHKVMRYTAMGMDIESNDFVGTKLFNMTEWVMFHNGEWYYMVFDYLGKVWVRFDKLKNVFAHAEEYQGRGPWVSYATNRHPKIFWNKAPLDDIRPIAYTMKKVTNLTLDNLEKRNWDMKAYNPKIFTEAAQLLYKQDGLAKATLERGQSIQSGIYQFQTPDTTSVTIALNEYLDRFLSTKSGIGEGLEGKPQDINNGIYFGSIEQSQNRISLKNKMFYQAMYDIATIFDYGCYEHLNEKYAVKILGINGIQWDEEVTKADLDRDFAIDITGGNDAEKQNAQLLTRKAATLDSIEKNPALMAKVNPNWVLREKLSAGGWDDEQIRVALDVQNDGNEEILSEAAEAIYEILEGEDPMLNRGATTGFVQKILDYSLDNFPLCTPDQIAKMSANEKKNYEENMIKFDKLTAYANAHIQIAMKNAIRRAASVIASKGGSPMDMNAQEAYQKGSPLNAIPQPVNNGGMPGAIPSPLQVNQQ